ncbi:hypothetical protein BDD12DRAFT_891035 [Trichophaea hybrida]|nr:hypothetical protein BDD12DRAFT_891035 [Trichophaea hybrida]
MSINIPRKVPFPNLYPGSKITTTPVSVPAISQPSQARSGVSPAAVSQLRAADFILLSPAAVPAAALSASIPGFPILPKELPKDLLKNLPNNVDRDVLIVRSYLHKNLNVDILNDLHRHLWWAGRPDNIRPLHQQGALQRTIVVNERSFLHLLWYEGTIYIKPLPAYLLSATFFAEYIEGDEKLWELALGFLRSYTKLIQYPVDLKLAKEKLLVPEDLKWETWSQLAAHFLHVPDKDINKRYYYGELRLARVNHAHRYCYDFPHTYYSPYVTYNQFFMQNFGGLFLVIVYISVILTAQQVLLATDEKKLPMGRYPIEWSCWWFSVVSLGVLGVTIVGLVVLVLGTFMNHAVCTICNLEKLNMDWVGVFEGKRTGTTPTWQQSDGKKRGGEAEDSCLGGVKWWV